MQGDSDSDAEDESNSTTQAAMAEAAAAEDAAFEEMVQSMQETAHKSRAKYESALQDSVFGHDASVAAQTIEAANANASGNSVASCTPMAPALAAEDREEAISADAITL